MKNLQIFNNPEFGDIRVTDQNGDPWFVAADVCMALEISNPTDALKRLDDDEKARFNLGLSGGATNCVNEPGLYALVLGSRKPEAKVFKRWITHEIIPSIRKNGSYSVSGQAVPEASAGGVADLIRITRRVLLESGSTPQDVRQMTKELYQTYHVQVPTPLQAPAQMNLLSTDYQMMLTE